MTLDPSAARAVTTFALACGVVLGATACTAHDPAPAPRPTRAAPAPSDAGGGAPASPSTTVGSAPSVLTCLPGDDRELAWLVSHGAARTDLGRSDVAMVEVGPGDDARETWWIVAAVSYSDAWGTRGEYNPVSYLTTAPGVDGDGRWISVGRALSAPEGSADWSAVSWDGERLERGRQAQAAALACLAESL